MLIHLLDSLDTDGQISREKNVTLCSQTQFNSIAYFHVILVCLVQPDKPE